MENFPKGSVPNGKKEVKIMPVKLNAKLIKKEEIIPGIFKFSVQAKEITDKAEPGNFIEIRVTDDIEPFLRRPISIYNMDKEKGILEFIFQVKGKGTKILSKKQVEDEIDILGPLGYGTFKFEKYQNIAIIGGGIGIFPLYELAKRAKLQNKNVKTYLGFRNKDLVMLESEFNEISNELVIATDDGSYGRNGFAINFLKEDAQVQRPDCIYACGPLPMLRAVKEFAEANNIPCQVSLEEKMGCGIGVCVGCAVKTAKSTKENPEYLGVCKAGPVFESKMVEF